ncbi:MAG: hypothetical protein RRA39_09925 [Cyanobacteriota bacterium PSP.bin.10]|jgi:hypothetical protein|nr:hypothetical protein [Cyanobacteriota bacterium PSP.bin.10]
MNTSLDSVTLPSSIQEIVEQVFRSGFLSLGQENRINELLFQRRYSEADLELLDCLSLALLNHQIETEKRSAAKAA